MSPYKVLRTVLFISIFDLGYGNGEKIYLIFFYRIFSLLTHTMYISSLLFSLERL